MRAEHKAFDLNKRISICELIKIDESYSSVTKERDEFKLQAQIKNIN
jgi:hypothetical protein